MKTIGCWLPASNSQLVFDHSQFNDLINSIRSPLYVVLNEHRHLGIASGGEISQRLPTEQKSTFALIACLPAIYPESLGDQNFQKAHGVKFCYVGGAMARGITSTKLVIELANAGMLAFFGAAGLSPKKVEQELLFLKQNLDPKNLPFGSNLIHTPNQPELEQKITELYLQLGVRKVCASAFMTLSKNIVWYASKGLFYNVNGTIKRHNHVFAKISRPEVAEHFMLPAPDAILQSLLAEGKLSALEVELARQIPIATDITVESDSGGHTDNRPLNALFSAIRELCNEVMQRYQYAEPIRLGAAGGLGTPQSLAAAFALGSSYVLLGTVHQAAIESGLSSLGRSMLATADIADVIMAPAADMFEMGAKVQVLRRGTLMGVRGNQLFELYKRYQSIEEIPMNIRDSLEKNLFKMPIEDIWQRTISYFTSVEPLEIKKAKENPKYKMALIFRWYLGNTSHWPLTGEIGRQLDYQIWCGPVIGAFNRWTKGTFLEQPEQRMVTQIALNLLEGAAVVTRAHQLRTCGITLPYQAFDYKPRMLY